tara:strand:- start:46 stop:222 length:177 start_codon:yes stop_codon:yes gene_type:complete
MDIQEELERTRLFNLLKSHILILGKLDELCQELSGMDTKEFIEVYDGLAKHFINDEDN